MAEKATDAESLPVSVVPEMSTWRGSDTEGGGKNETEREKRNRRQSVDVCFHGNGCNYG